jgi:hypothetical protein
MTTTNNRSAMGEGNETVRNTFHPRETSAEDLCFRANTNRANYLKEQEMANIEREKQERARREREKQEDVVRKEREEREEMTRQEQEKAIIEKDKARKRAREEEESLLTHVSANGFVPPQSDARVRASTCTTILSTMRRIDQIRPFDRNLSIGGKK